MPKTQLKTAPLGATGLEITRIGFGAWAIGGGGWEFGWGPQEDDESVAAIHHALVRTPGRGTPGDRTCSPKARCWRGPGGAS